MCSIALNCATDQASRIRRFNKSNQCEHVETIRQAIVPRHFDSKSSTEISAVSILPRLTQI